MNLPEYQKRFAPMLAPLGKAYGACMAARRAVWESGLVPRFDTTRPCISVGNIAWGGTGKTPVVDWLLDWAVSHGLTAAVLTRGYGAKPPEAPLLVQTHHTAQQAGDEPLMLARRHPEAAILVDPKRVRAGAWAAANLHPQLYVLDDGFQHLAVRRDLDLVVLRPDDVLDQWNRVIPAGSWREGPLALYRAHAFLMKMEPDAFGAMGPLLEERLGSYGVPVFSFRLKVRELVRVGARGETAPDLGGRPYVLVSGVGDPHQVRVTAEHYFGYAPARHCVFPDHHPFTLADKRALAAENMPLVCTPKDAVKLDREAPPDLWTFRLETVFGPALGCDHGFPRWWEDAWARLNAGQPPA